MKLSEFTEMFNIKVTIVSSFCLDAYGSQLWNFESKMVEPYYVSWRKMVQLLWNLPRTTLCDFLSTINSSLSIDIALEKAVASFLWVSLNSENKVVKMVTLSSIKAAQSVLGDNYSYLSHKYSINLNDWFWLIYVKTLLMIMI